jgi:NAD(P)-dependent dehydrogenase (short-subunit alcohol dehydrogenase family)
MTGPIAGRVAVVTGGANGIGAAVSRRLATAGATVVVVDRDPVRTHALAAEIGGTPVIVDLTAPDASRRALAAAEKRHGRVDLVHLNAGMLCGMPDITRVTPTQYRTVMALNVDAVFYGVQAAIPALRRSGGGAILVTGSIAGLNEFEFDPVYAMTKHAVTGIVRALALPLAAEGIRISAICPAFVDTGFIGPYREMFQAAGYPLMSPAEVAEAAVAELIDGEPGRALVVEAGAPPTPFPFTDALRPT